MEGWKRIKYDELIMVCKDAIHVRVGNSMHSYHSGQIVGHDKKKKLLSIIESKMERRTEEFRWKPRPFSNTELWERLVAEDKDLKKEKEGEGHDA